MQTANSANEGAPISNYGLKMYSPWCILNNVEFYRFMPATHTCLNGE